MCVLPAYMHDMVTDKGGILKFAHTESVVVSFTVNVSHRHISVCYYQAVIMPVLGMAV